MWEATALPIVPQPIPLLVISLSSTSSLLAYLSRVKKSICFDSVHSVSSIQNFCDFCEQQDSTNNWKKIGRVVVAVAAVVDAIIIGDVENVIDVAAVNNVIVFADVIDAADLIDVRELRLYLDPLKRIEIVIWS